jgi:Pyruvate/2-oxoacid:ferredoxin oxidoreductase delta subunit
VPGVEFDWDVVQVKPSTLMTGAPGIFAGGDAVPSQRTVTIGVGHGKRAARSIDAWLASEEFAVPAKHPIIHSDGLNLWYFGDHDRRVQDELDPQTRVAAFEEVVAGLSEQEAVFEAGRCLSCGNCFECDGCFGSCPEDAIIKLGKGQRYRFDYSACTGCGTCYRQCPVHAIEMVPEPHPEPADRSGNPPLTPSAVRPTMSGERV